MSSHLPRSAAVLGLGLMAALAPRRTTAAPTVHDVRAAREQFDLAVADEDAGRWGDALARLRRIAAVKDTAGVRYHVALCEEQLGHLASALTDYRAAEQAAQSDPSKSRDVLRLVGRRIDGLVPRVPTLTVRVEAAGSVAAVRVDGRPAPAEEPILLDPGSHPIEVEATEGSGSVTVDVAEGEKKVVLVPLERPPSATGLGGQAEPVPASDERAVTIDGTMAARGTGAPAAPGPRRAGGPRASALFEAAGAAVLAGAGAVAFAEAGSMRDAGMRSCAQVTSLAPSACDAERAPVRAWDWIAVGAWAGAAGLATLAVVSWSTPRRGGSGNVTVGLGVVRWGGEF